MKRFLLLLSLVMVTFSTSLQAQESNNLEKKRVLVDYFSTLRNPMCQRYLGQVRNQVISGISATGRLVVIDVDSEETLKVEESRRMDKSAMGDELARVGEMKKLGANFGLFGSLDNIVVERKKTDDGKVYYNATISVTLKAVRVDNGSLHGSDIFSIYGGGIGSGTTEDKAVTSAVSAIRGKMETFVDKYFPLNGTIVEVKEQKRGKLISCYIDLGTALGVSKGQYVKVMAIRSIAGRESKIELGRMKVEETIAADRSECKVTKNGDDIFEAFNAGDPLVIETIKDAGLGGALKSFTY